MGVDFRLRVPGFAAMKFAELSQLVESLLAPSGGGQGSDRQELVGGLAHGRDNHHRPLCDARFDDACHPRDGLSGFDGGAAEFHHDHRASQPSECISSAFSTAAPAAPRTVLWPSATNL